ncbi:MAG: TetR/AcrR family transcriptional regulator [Rhodospirillaceae bacterium]|nr:TetR/AcrR family transcriptional regulator [Rhodospirillaceae bacterium]
MSTVAAASAPERDHKPRSPRIAQRRERMRQGVLRTAARMFLERGISNVSVEDVLAEADLARSTFYSFFSSKRDLLSHIFSPVFESGAAHLRGLAGQPPAQVAYGMIDMYPMLWERFGDALLLRIPNDDFALIEKAHNAYVGALNERLIEVERAGLLRNGSAAYTVRLIARSAIDIVRVYRNDPKFTQLYRTTVEGMLLVDSAHRSPNA